MTAQREIKRGKQPQICADHGVRIKNVNLLAHGRQPSTASDFQNMLNAQTMGFALSFEPLEEGSDDEATDNERDGSVLRTSYRGSIREKNTVELYTKQCVFESIDHDRNVIHCVDQRRSITHRMEVPLNTMDHVQLQQIKQQIDQAQAEQKQMKIVVVEDRHDERYASFVRLDATWC